MAERSCAFCGRSDVAELIEASSRVLVCQACVVACGEFIDGSRPPGLEGATRAGAAEVPCSFCAGEASRAAVLITPSAAICGDCLALCRDIVELASDLPREIRRTCTLCGARGVDLYPSPARLWLCGTCDAKGAAPIGFRSLDASVTEVAAARCCACEGSLAGRHDTVQGEVDDLCVACGDRLGSALPAFGGGLAVVRTGIHRIDDES